MRGTAGESVGEILARVDADSLYRFDQTCCIRALELAHALGANALLSINFLPNVVYAPQACIQATLATARDLGWPLERISFEIAETEHVRDRAHLENIVDAYRAMGFSTALDDFGTGYANLDLLVDFLRDTLKLDSSLSAAIDASRRRQAIVEGIVQIATGVGVGLIAEGVETEAEARWLYRCGIARQQGYFYARPAIETLPASDPGRVAAVRA